MLFRRTRVSLLRTPVISTATAWGGMKYSTLSQRSRLPLKASRCAVATSSLDRWCPRRGAHAGLARRQAPMPPRSKRPLSEPRQAGHAICGKPRGGTTPAPRNVSSWRSWLAARLLMCRLLSRCPNERGQPAVGRPIKLIFGALHPDDKIAGGLIRRGKSGSIRAYSWPHPCTAQC
jgi:hypothetical protein